MAIRGLAMASEAFTAIGYPNSKLATILNRADATGGITKADLEETLGQPIDFEIVSDGRLVLAANNEGVPFVASRARTRRSRRGSARSPPRWWRSRPSALRHPALAGHR